MPFGHVFMILMEHIFGDYHPVTYAFAFIVLLWSLYLFISFLKINKMAYAIRYGIQVVPPKPEKFYEL